MRVNYCRKHRIPERAEDFLNPIREELVSAIEKANELFSEQRDVYIYYPGYGEKSAGIHSRVRRGTEVAAMITSLLHHGTMMTVEANCIDSHGQSELGFRAS